MMYIKRTLILSKICNTDKKIIAYLQKGDGNPYIIVKSIDLQDKQAFALLRYSNSPIDLIKLNLRDNDLVGELPNYFDCSEEVLISIIILYKGKIIPYYLGGAKEQQQDFHNEILKNLSYYNTKCMALIDKDLKPEIVEIANQNTENTFKDSNKVQIYRPELFEETNEDEITDTITDTLIMECLNQTNKCENCKYKKVFFEDQNNEQLQGNIFKEDEIKTIKEDDLINEEDKNKPNEEESKILLIDDNISFYKQIEKSLRALFDTYPKDEVLENALTDSNFVKVDYENTGDYYSVGYIKENDIPKYICYAIPCTPNSPPPENMEDFSQYLLVNENLAYYLMYQNASDGETINISAI